MNLLFVCSRNQWRSPTAEKVFDQYPHHARSAGTSPNARIRLSQKHIDWADIIFVMEKRHRNMVQERFSELLYSKRVIVLDIPDDYDFMNEELIDILKTTVTPYLDIVR